MNRTENQCVRWGLTVLVCVLASAMLISPLLTALELADLISSETSTGVRAVLPWVSQILTAVAALLVLGHRPWWQPLAAVLATCVLPALGWMVVAVAMIPGAGRPWPTASRSRLILAIVFNASLVLRGLVPTLLGDAEVVSMGVVFGAVIALAAAFQHVKDHLPTATEPGTATGPHWI